MAEHVGLSLSEELLPSCRRLVGRRLTQHLSLLSLDQRRAWIDEEADSLAEALAEMADEHCRDLLCGLHWETAR
jgi:hypothetical protein